MVQSYPINQFRVPAGRRFSQPVCLLVPLLLLLVAGCQRDQVKVYRVAKDQNPPPPQTAPALPTDSPNSTLPAGHPDISSLPAASLPAASGSAEPSSDLENARGLDGGSAFRNARGVVQGVRSGRQTSRCERGSPARHDPVPMMPMSTAGAVRSACPPWRRTS